ncbi:growth arrest-specific protein 1-like [Cimex lectularius]|uniref:GDNF/GAS1 domain-containing protein n=1 Tax=Cimex lectularius TaxID=79782 RepID=A0A8I6TLZ7_CIMLE|nr:growth arrest-specific protein 1-like [Cimex lectularius]
MAYTSHTHTCLGEQMGRLIFGFTLFLIFLCPLAQCILCEEARLKCALRDGCGTALQGYFLSCSELHKSRQLTSCPEDCLNSLIALTSTHEGKQLMNCECGDDLCRKTKDRVDVCRPQVIKASMNETIVSCVVAQWICGVDPVCAKALSYYNHYCRSMFLGKRCSARCENSINILRRQEKAAKLNSCTCDGKEEYDCDSIRRNMDRMCFAGKKKIQAGSRRTNDLCVNASFALKSEEAYTQDRIKDAVCKYEAIILRA